ncbi:prolyl 4-hydroxylase subunit alpha-2-like [Choloepus didactylus]|uniref:prolyl 4-hydroxylase subunit alpha-2-like n=1 Tax=Choloepus didactylus TaxID=27675 RepID=UPI00189D587E|nr:prolyl 4-hydroxylase subunit alpha-2-like [Choloepus didactylus]
MKLEVSTLVMAWLGLLGCTWAEFFTFLTGPSLHAGHMTSLIHVEKQLVQALKEYILLNEAKLSMIKSWVEKRDALNLVIPEDEEGLSMAVSMYKMLRHLNKDWSVVKSFVLQNPSTEFSARLTSWRKHFPTEEDEIGAARALLRLQHIYKLDLKALSKGALPGTRYRTTLSVGDCFKLGQTAHSIRDFHHSVLWMQQTLKQLNAGEHSTISKVQVLNYLSSASFQLRDLHRAVDFTHQLLSLDSSHEQARLNLPCYVRLLEEERTGKLGNRASETNSETVISAHEDSLNHLPTWEVFEGLCRGEGVKLTPQKRKMLFCRYHHGNRTPQLLIAPFKEEDEWDSPHIVRYYNVISDEEIERIKEIAKPKMERSNIFDVTTSSTHASISRISKSAFLIEEEDPVIGQVNRRIKFITGLSDKTAELLQVASYGIGGLYGPNLDYFLGLEQSFETDESGNRVATFLNYMSDVEAGGATVFPELGVIISPKKGTALFWYNLLRSGKGNHLTRHGSCPVLVGCKWVSNKWFHERGQEFLRPCGPTEVD